MSGPTMPSRSNFRPLQTINEERSTHGLRYGDYTRYRKHCARKAHHIRSSLKITHGKGREFKKLQLIAPEGAKEGQLQLLLFETERAWAHAHELFAAQESRRSVARYRRSHTYLTRLLNLARSPNLGITLSSQSIVELIIYSLIHTARFNLRRSHASTAAFYDLEHGTATDKSGSQDTTPTHALVHLCIAHALLGELEKNACTTKDVALARAFKDDVAPEIRWCVHEFNRGKDAGDDVDIELENHVLAWKSSEWDIDGIVGDVAPAYGERVVKGFGDLVRAMRRDATAGGEASERKGVLEELVWDGEPVPVRNPEMVDVLLKVQEATRKLNVDGMAGANLKERKGGGRAARARLARYDGVLLTLSDTVDQARKLVDAHQVTESPSNMVSGAGSRDIQFMHWYVTYQHLIYRIERDLLLLATLSEDTPGETAPNTGAILHLLSGVLQSLSQTLTLPIADETPDLSTALSLRVSHTKATRALHLARAYSDQVHKRYAEAVSLTQRGRLHVREARSTLSILPADSSCLPQLQFYPLDAKALDELEEQLMKDEERYKIEWFGHNGGIIGPTETSDASEKHRKPLFFDIAFNYVEPPMGRLRARAGLPPREDEGGAKAEREEEQEEQGDTVPEDAVVPRGGLARFLGTWWGRG